MLHYEDESVVLHHGDCIDVLKDLPDCSVDSVVTDPPYALEFMGQEWDAPWKQVDADEASTANAATGGMAGHISANWNDKGAHSRGFWNHDSKAFQQWCEKWAAECYRVLKPGGHLLAFGGTRTVHRLTAGIEDAGFEIRDSIMWIYGSGFPKSMDVAKAIDKKLGVEGSYDGVKPGHEDFIERTDAFSGGGRSDGWDGPWKSDAEAVARSHQRYIPGSEQAQQWEGWGTALKPAHEPIVVARKPFAKTLAENVMAHGVGALNIDGNRVAFASEADERESKEKNRHADFGTPTAMNTIYNKYDVPSKNYDAPGRWPSNVTLDPAAAAELDQQSGDRGESGSASRYFPVFRYEPKAATVERPKVDGEAHPTVKPLDLMRWLVKLVTPKGGTVLEPFAGSGTTAEACVIEGFKCVAVERHAPYLPLIVARLSKPIQMGML